MKMYINLNSLLNLSLNAWQSIFVVICLAIAIKFLSEILKGLK